MSPGWCHLHISLLFNDDDDDDDDDDDVVFPLSIQDDVTKPPTPSQVLLIAVGWELLIHSFQLEPRNTWELWIPCHQSFLYWVVGDLWTGLMKEKHDQRRGIWMFAQHMWELETDVTLRVLVKYGMKDRMGNLLFAHLLCSSVVPRWEWWWWWWVLNSTLLRNSQAAGPLESSTKTCSGGTTRASLMTPLSLSASWANF